MPLEVRELIIKTKIENQSGESSGANNSGSDQGSQNIREIAEMVLKILKDKLER